jgi:hypothetical protein
VSPSPASSGTGSSTGDGGECNATPGAWKCVGRSLQQCVQNRKSFSPFSKSVHICVES